MMIAKDQLFISYCIFSDCHIQFLHYERTPLYCSYTKQSYYNFVIFTLDKIFLFLICCAVK